MIQFLSGNIFETHCQAIVNPVNCVGVMGKGLALQFKLKDPGMFKTYQDACQLKQLIPGKCQIIPTDKLGDKVKYIINFPTKSHWRNPSALGYIRFGLIDLICILKKYGITSCAIPALGCGCGELAWVDVKSLIVEILHPFDSLNFIIYNPMKGIQNGSIDLN